jgi:hypothetical protein
MVNTNKNRMHAEAIISKVEELIPEYLIRPEDANSEGGHRPRAAWGIT